MRQCVWLSGPVMMVARRHHRSVHIAFGVFHRHHSTALEGQYGNREPKEKAEEQAHDPDMVPQIKNVHQGTGFFVAVRRTSYVLAMVMVPTVDGLYLRWEC
jgi:hypothetical protein